MKRVKTKCGGNKTKLMPTVLISSHTKDDHYNHFHSSLMSFYYYQSIEYGSYDRYSGSTNPLLWHRGDTSMEEDKVMLWWTIANITR